MFDPKRITIIPGSIPQLLQHLCVLTRMNSNLPLITKRKLIKRSCFILILRINLLKDLFFGQQHTISISPTHPKLRYMIVIIISNKHIIITKVFVCFRFILCHLLFILFLFFLLHILLIGGV